MGRKIKISSVLFILYKYYKLLPSVGAISYHYFLYIIRGINWLEFKL